MGAVSAAQHADLLAKHYGVCVVMHTDHANRGLVPWVEGVLTESEAHHAATLLQEGGFTFDIANRGSRGRDTCKNPLFSYMNEEQ